MKPMAALRKPVMVRMRSDTFWTVRQLAADHGQRIGPFLSMICEAIGTCEKENLHAALAAFEQVAKRKRLSKLDG